MSTAENKPRARHNGRIWQLTPPVSRPGFHFHYLSRSLKAAYEHWNQEALQLERVISSQCSRP